MPMSITYLAVILLAALGVENAEDVVEAAATVIVALIGLWGRYRLGDLNLFGFRK